jgi:cytoskeletal protein CcmA (bactofilin family)
MINQLVHTHISKVILGLLTLAILLPQLAEARTVVRSGDTVSIGQDQLIEGDLYAAGNIVNVSGQITEDLLLAASEVNVNGAVGEDVFIMAGNVDINATVGDDVRILGGTAIIAEPVLGDVFVVGGTVKILSTATIAGDLTVVGSVVEVAGSVDGRVLGWVESLRLDSSVGGDVEVSTASLTLGDNANISGNITYESVNQLVRSQNATVAGEIIRNDPAEPEPESPITAILMPLLILLFSVALWFLLSRYSLQRVVQHALSPGVRPILIGTLVLLLGPFAVGILFVSMLGMLGGVALLATYMLFITLAIIALPAVVAHFVYNLFKGERTPITLLTLVLGAVLVVALMAVPVVGPILLVGFFVLTFGALLDLLFRANR